MREKFRDVAVRSGLQPGYVKKKEPAGIPPRTPAGQNASGKPQDVTESIELLAVDDRRRIRGTDPGRGPAPWSHRDKKVLKVVPQVGTGERLIDKPRGRRIDRQNMIEDLSSRKFAFSPCVCNGRLKEPGRLILKHHRGWEGKAHGEGR